MHAYYRFKPIQVFIFVLLNSLMILVVAGVPSPHVFSQGDEGADSVNGYPIWDENVLSILGQPGDELAADVSINQHEGYIGWDKESSQHLPDPTSDVVQDLDSEVEGLIADKSAELDASRLIYRSGFQQQMVPGLDPAWMAQIAALSDIFESQGFGVIQFPLPFDTTVRTELEEAGVQFYNYVEGGGLYARVPSEALATLQTLFAAGQVRYAGAIPLEAKLDNFLLDSLNNGEGEALNVTVQLFDVPTEDQLNQIETLLQVERHSLHPTLPLLQGVSQNHDISALASMPYVRWVELNLPYYPTNLESTMALGTDVLRDHNTSSTGAGVRIAVIDTGVGTHADLPANRIVDQREFYPSDDATANDTIGHGTHVAGTIGGDGTNSAENWLQGHAPGAQLLIYKLCCNASGAGFPSADFQDSLIRGSDNGMNIVSNSWGGGNGTYSISAEIADRAVRGEYGERVVVVVSAGNDNALVSSPASAKNVVSVGAIKDGNWPNNELFSCGGNSDTNWPPGQRVCFSNYGPLDVDGDGRTRIKPDLVATGVRVSSTIPGGSYAYYDGTSMAAPAVSGVAATLLDHYSDTVPALFDWPEIMKAMLLATATEVGGNTSLYGRGMVNSFHSAYFQPGITGVGRFWGNAIGSTGESLKFTFTVPANYNNVRVVLTWPDPAGSAEVANDLDLYVYNNSSCTGSPLRSSQSYDDTVEFIRIPSGYTSGTWCALVRGYSLSSSNQTFGLFAHSDIKAAALQVSTSLSQSYAGAGENLFYYTTVSNSGTAAGGTYIRVSIPSSLTLLGARVYTDDGRSHYYDDSELYFANGYWRIATGSLIAGSPRLVRWFVQVNNTSSPGSYNLYANAYHRLSGNLVASNNSRLTPVNVPGVYLPFIEKQ